LGAAGLITFAVGLGTLAALAYTPGSAMALPLALCGLGFGLFQSPNNHTIVMSSPSSRAGAASGMMGTARLTGQSLGATLAAVAFASHPAGAVSGPASALAVASALALVAALASGLRTRVGPGQGR
jgi:DHA2 family multidrug resistance protein-like MFS transporter